MPTPVPPEDPAVTAIAHREFVAWQIGVVNKARYTPDLAAAITDDKIKQSSAALAQLGTFERSEYVGPATIADALSIIPASASEPRRPRVFGSFCG